MKHAIILLALAVSTLTYAEPPALPSADECSEPHSADPALPALHTAILSGDAEQCRRILPEWNATALNTPCESIENRGISSIPLLLAAELGRADIVRMLLAAGARVNATEPRRHNTALHQVLRSCADGSISEDDCAATVTALLEADAPLNIQNDDEETPIDIAAELEHIDLLQYLLDHSAASSEKR